MRRSLELCLRWPLLVAALVAIVVTLGAKSALDLPIDAVPDITNVQVQVLTNAPALGPIDVERTITFPIESAMSGIPNVEEIRSVSRFGLSAVTVRASRRSATAAPACGSGPVVGSALDVSRAALFGGAIIVLVYVVE